MLVGKMGGSCSSVVVALNGSRSGSIIILGAADWRQVRVKAGNLRNLQTPRSSVNFGDAKGSIAQMESQLVAIGSSINVHVLSAVCAANCGRVAATGAGDGEIVGHTS